MAEGTLVLPPDSTGKTLRTVTNAGVAGGAHQEVVTLADSAGTMADVTKLANLDIALSALRDALETITVGGSVALDAATLAALENIVVSGTVALDAATLAALESITATISGSVAVTGPLTDAQLRATPVPVSTTFPADLTATGNLTALNSVLDRTIAGQGGGAFTLTGTWVGTVSLEGSSDGGTTYQSMFFFGSGLGFAVTSTYQNGVYRFNCGSLSHVRLKMTAYTSGTAAAAIRLSDDQPAITIVNPQFQHTPYNHLKVTEEPGTLFYDPFEGALDTTNRWNAPTGTLAVGTSSTVLSITPTTANNVFGAIESRPRFNAIIPGFLQHSWALQFEGTTFKTGCHRFFGIGTAPATPTMANPLTDAIGFEIDTNGKMRAVVYKGGTRIFEADLSVTGTGAANNQQPLTGGWHRYICQVRTDLIYWYINTPQQPVVTASFQVPDTQIMPVRMATVQGGSSQPGATFNCQGIAVADTSKQGAYLKDSTYPWRGSTVNEHNLLAVNQTTRKMTPLSVTKTGTLTDDVLVSVSASQRIRVLKNAGHCDPATASGTYPVATLKIGSTTIFSDKLEAGLPWAEQCCFEGALGDDLTLTLSTGTVFLNMRYELF